jgi:hypothetical protein
MLQPPGFSHMEPMHPYPYDRPREYMPVPDYQQSASRSRVSDKRSVSIKISARRQNKYRYIVFTCICPL